MEAKDLRIGNLVTDEWFDSFKAIITVDSINDKGINLTIEDDGNWSELAQHFIVPEYNFDKLRGIPLTEDWLLKFGFEKIDNGSYPVFHKDNFYFELVNHKKIGFIFPKYWSIKIEYVHQLQNLYYALTGQELML